MVVHNEIRKKIWETPLAIFVMTCVVGAGGWYFDLSIKRELQHIDTRFDQNEALHEKLWTALNGYQSKIACLQVKVAECCNNEPTCI